jgi:hypothetical protein
MAKKTPTTSKQTRNKLPKPITKALEQAETEVMIARAAAGESKQPRFDIDLKDLNRFVQSIFKFSKEAIYNEPPYRSDSAKRDEWLSKVVTKEPYLLGILQSVVAIDKNRGWNMIGGRNQVRKFVGITHNFQVAPDLFGWRPGISVTSQSYYQADMGGVVELGRMGNREGPLAALYAVDPTQCYLTGKQETPLRYKNTSKENQLWTLNDYFRVVSFPSTNEKMNGLGFCAVSRCIELAKLLVSVYEHDREKLGSKAPKGILTINGVTMAQWLQSVSENEPERTALERAYYTGVQVLAAGQGEPAISVALTSLSELPADFDHYQFVSMIIYGYALAFGYDPREFWPVSGGSLGSATESETMHRKATSKGGLDFALNFQENYQRELPPTVEFQFEQRDVDGDISEATLKKAVLDIIDRMYQSVNAENVNLITREEARILLVEAKIIPDDWTIEDEPQQIEDVDDAGAEELLASERVRRAMDKFPNEQIVAYSSNANTYRTIYDPQLRKYTIAVKRAVKKKTPNGMKSRRYEGDYESVRAAYHDATYTIVRDYLESSDRSTVYKSAMGRNVVEAFTPAAELGYENAGGELPLEDDANDWLTDAQSIELGNVELLFDSLKQIRDSGEFDAEKEATDRANGYASTLDGIYNKGTMYGLGNKMLTFEGEDGEKSCKDCQRLQGQRHKASWWIEHDYIPPHGAGLECAPGGHCLHELVDDDGEVWTV